MSGRLWRGFPFIPTTMLLLAVAVTSGCEPTPVFRVQSDRNSGVPFFPLIAVDKETVTFEQSWLRLDALINTDPGEGSKAPRISTSVTLFSGDDESGSRVQALVGELGKLTTVSEMLARLNAAAGFSYATPAVETIADLAVEAPAPHLHRIGRTLEVTQEISTEPFYLNVLTPRGGSANADVKLTDHGVLADLSGQRQDQLPGAIASIMGTVGSAAATALLTPAAAAAPTGSGAATAPLRDFALTGPTPALKKKATASVSISITPMRRTYTITRYWIPDPVVRSPQGSIAAGSPMGDFASRCAQNNNCRMELKVGEIEVALKLGFPEKASNKN